MDSNQEKNSKNQETKASKDILKEKIEIKTNYTLDVSGLTKSLESLIKSMESHFIELKESEKKKIESDLEQKKALSDNNDIKKNTKEKFDTIKKDVKDFDFNEESFDKLKKCFKDIAEAVPDDKVISLIGNLGSSLSTFGGSLSKMDFSGALEGVKDGLGALSKTFSNDPAMGNLTKWGISIASATQDFFKGNFVEGSLKMTSTIFSIKSANKKANEEIRKFYKEIEQSVLKYSIALISNVKNKTTSNDSLFTKDKNNKLHQGVSGYNQAKEKLAELNESLEGEKVVTKIKKKKFLGITTGTKKVWGDFRDNYKQILGVGDDVELFDKETKKLDLTMANVLSNNDKLSDEAKTTLNNMIALQAAADQAMEAVDSILNGYAGSMGSSFQDALVNAFKGGEDAADSFGRSVSSTLESIVADQLFNTYFGKALADLEKNMKSSYEEGGDMDITDDIVNFYKEYGKKTEEFNAAMSEAKSKLDGEGISIFDKTKTSQDSTRSSFTSMTQEQGNELSGRFLALQECGIHIAGNSDQELSLAIGNNTLLSEQTNKLTELCSTNLQSMYYLEDIKKNTNHLAGIKQDLQDIKQNTSRL